MKLADNLLAAFCALHVVGHRSATNISSSFSSLSTVVATARNFGFGNWFQQEHCVRTPARMDVIPHIFFACQKTLSTKKQKQEFFKINYWVIAAKAEQRSANNRGSDQNSYQQQIVIQQHFIVPIQFPSGKHWNMRMNPKIVVLFILMAINRGAI